ncbi:hypothetical protein [Limosilactobacillus reuteri]|uniref:hypothetical protein n=1 Tax=Limosilactobacillus reuteri TaxID=1598 RepID=UPI002F262729
MFRVEGVKYRHHISQAIKRLIMMQLTANESQTDVAEVYSKVLAEGNSKNF